MAKANEKQAFIRENYINTLKRAKETFETRKGYLKEWDMNSKNEDKDGESSGGESGGGNTDVETGQSDYTINGQSIAELSKLSLKGKSGLTAEQINSWINSRTKNKVCVNCGQQSHMYNSGEWFIEAEAKAGFRADAMASHAAWESGWGTSTIACKKKNYFGWGAYDNDPYNKAKAWSTIKEGLIGAATKISEQYVYRSQNYSGKKDQDTFLKMNNSDHQYATDGMNWVNGICGIWKNAPATESSSLSNKIQPDSRSFALTAADTPTETNTQVTVHGWNSSSDTKNRNPYTVKKGRIRGINYLSPKYVRNDYVRDWKKTTEYTSKVGYAPLPANEFIHLGGPQDNFYSKDARDVFSLLKMKLGKRTLTISRGYEPEAIGNESSHTIGIAMDIYCGTAEEALRIADTAWLLGIRGIAIGPKFVHVDTGPPASWGYGKLPIYHGPGTVRVGDIRYGF